MNPKKRDHLLILIGNEFFGADAKIDGLNASQRAQFTTERSRISEANAVVFHVPDLVKQPADIPKYPGQLWVAWSMESSVNYPELADSKFMRHFDLRMTYESDADIWVPYLPTSSAWRVAQQACQRKASDAPVVMFQSAGLDRSGRGAFSAELMHHIGVSSYGRFLRNSSLSVADEGRSTKLTTISRYLFCLAQENSIAVDYVTEKLFDPLMVGTVPIYRGAPNVRDFAPDDSFIDADAYGDPKGLAEYLHWLLKNPTEYERYFAWHRKPLPPKLQQLISICDICPWVRLLHTVDGRLRAIKHNMRE